MKAKKVVIKAAQKKSVGQFIAAISQGFLPIASYTMAHHEIATRPDCPWLWAVVGCALVCSAPTLAIWATRFLSPLKAWAYTVVLEMVMVASHTQALSLVGLFLLCAINAVNAWEKMGKPFQHSMKRCQKNGAARR